MGFLVDGGVLGGGEWGRGKGRVEFVIMVGGKGREGASNFLFLFRG